MAQYPTHRETDVVLRDGSTVHVRPAKPDDRNALEDYFIALEDESRRLRFLGSAVDVAEQARNAVEIDYADHMTLLAFTGENADHVVGGAQYIRLNPSTAEIAMSVGDALQGRGLGSLLLAHLADAARESGIRAFRGEMLPENHTMLDVLRRAGFRVSIRAKPGIVEVELPTELSEEGAERYEERERTAAANAVRAFLEARSVAVIGASRDPDTVGGRLLRNLLQRPFAGVVYPVNPAGDAVQGVTAFPSIAHVPGDVDLAFVAVPAAGVVDVARECALKGVRAIVVISAGFGETGDAGARLQQELLEVCRASGMRLVGPNCMGIINTDPAVDLNGTFIQAHPPEGRVAFMSQSGALGIAVINMAAALGLGLSSFVSVGNKADVSGNDLLCYWAEDPRTDVVLLYLESFGNPRRFAELARRIGRQKPIVAVKSGRSVAGRRAALSHTGALLATSDTTVAALLRQVGVIRTDTLEEMLDVATLLANQPIPRGRNVAILTNAGGLGIQCADACEARGLRVPELSPATVTKLSSFLPPAASVSNPVDMIASAAGGDYGKAIAAIAADPGVDALVVLYIPPLESSASDVARHLVDAIGGIERRIPALTCFMSARGLPEALTARGVRIPSYGFPEQAAIALSHAAAHGAWLAADPGSVVHPHDIRVDEATAVIARALDRGDTWLRPDEMARLFDCYGLHAPRQVTVTTAAETVEAARRIGGPVVLKAVGPLHKTEVGAIRLGLAASQVADEAEAMIARVAAHGVAVEGFVVQEQVEGGAEMLVGIAADPEFGPVVACGAGGVNVELTRDIAVRIAPLTDVEAAGMIRSLATFPILDGYRGAPPRDVRALEDVVLRMSAMAEQHPAIAEVDCNPVLVLERGAVIVDARVRVRVPQPESPWVGRA